MQDEKRNWAEFPSLTEQEVLVEDALAPLRNKLKVPEGIPALEALFQDLRKDLETQDTRGEAEAKSYWLIAGLIETPRRVNETKALSKSRLFKRLRPEVVFSLAIKAVRTDNSHALEVIAGTTKKEHPMHPDLPKFRVGDGETLGHMAARCDHHKILDAIWKIDPECLDCENNQGDNPSHTASRYNAWQCLDLIADVRPDLFAKRNHEGQTPLDLNGAEIIKTKIGVEEATTAGKEAEKKKSQAKKVLEAASRKKPGKPMIQVKNGRLRVARPTKNGMEFGL